MPKRSKSRPAPTDGDAPASLAALKILQPRLLAPLCIRFSEVQRTRLHRAALQVAKDRGSPIDDSTLARELVMRGVSRVLEG